MEAKAQIDTSKDADFARALQTAGLAADLTGAELSKIVQGVTEPRIDLRRMDILERYYAARGDSNEGARRAKADRFFVHNVRDAVTAHQVVARLAMLNPEISPVYLQRIGTDDGPLVLRAGDHFSAVADDDDESADADTVAIRAIIRAFNALLDRSGVSVRLIPLLPNDARELYLGVNKDGGLALLQAGYLELLTEESLGEFAHW